MEKKNRTTLRELEQKFINQQIMYQEWFKNIKEELKELRKFLQEDKANIDKLAGDKLIEGKK